MPRIEFLFRFPDLWHKQLRIRKPASSVRGFFLLGFVVHAQREVDLDVQADELIVEGDQGYLELLVGNLLANADKYSPNSEPMAGSGTSRIPPPSRSASRSRDEARSR